MTERIMPALLNNHYSINDPDNSSNREPPAELKNAKMSTGWKIFHVAASILTGGLYGIGLGIWALCHRGSNNTRRMESVNSGHPENKLVMLKPQNQAEPKVSTTSEVNAKEFPILEKTLDTNVVNKMHALIDNASQDLANYHGLERENKTVFKAVDKLLDNFIEKVGEKKVAQIIYHNRGNETLRSSLKAQLFYSILPKYADRGDDQELRELTGRGKSQKTGTYGELLELMQRRLNKHLEAVKHDPPQKIVEDEKLKF